MKNSLKKHDARGERCGVQLEDQVNEPDLINLDRPLVN